MKIAFLLLNQKDHIRRGLAFMKHSKDYDFSFIFLTEEWERHSNIEFKPKYPIPEFAKVIHSNESPDLTCYDLVLPMADKVCDFLFNRIYPSLINVNNKRTLQQKIDEFGKFDSIRSSTNSFFSDFADEDDVIVKPSISSGGFSSDPLCYSRQKFKNVKHLFYNKEYLIQEYIDTDQVPYLILINNSEDLMLLDIYDQEWAPSVSGNFYSPFMETQLALKDKFKTTLGLIHEFFEFIGLKDYRGFFGLQFMALKNKLIPIDCNLRTGPVSLEIEHRNLANIATYKVIPFLLKEKTPEELAEELKLVDRVRSYVEIDGNLVTQRKFEPNVEERVCIRSDKTSGVFRREYQVYIEKVK